MNLKSAAILCVVIAFLSILFLGRYLATHQPVTITMKFDPKSQVLKIALRNDSDESVDFYDSLSAPQAGSEFLKDVPTALCVTVYSKDGRVLSKGGFPDGCITVRLTESTLEQPFAHPMNQLLPRQTFIREVKLKELIGVRSPYSELTKLREFCVQFKVWIYFDPYLRFPEMRESEVSCVSDL